MHVLSSVFFKVFVLSETRVNLGSEVQRKMSKHILIFDKPMNDKITGQFSGWLEECG